LENVLKELRENRFIFLKKETEETRTKMMGDTLADPMEWMTLEK
jgi:hypothetical protein